MMVMSDDMAWLTYCAKNAAYKTQNKWEQ